MNAYLQVDEVNLTFPGQTRAQPVLRHVSLRINRGECVVLVGHSGCGKSTLLGVLAGLVTPDRGTLLLDNRGIDGPGPDRAMVFQNHCLLPWLTVYENVRLAVDQVFGRTRSSRERHDWTLEHLRRVSMEAAARKYPRELSGGMKQRVGIARALAMEPKVLLMDEPFGALDALTRRRLQNALLEIHEHLQNTIVLVTHDVDEAVLLGDRIVLMSPNGPESIAAVLENRVPKPRPMASLNACPEYPEQCAEVLRFLYASEDQPERAGGSGGVQ